MNWSKFIRQAHRVLSIVFTVAVIINMVALATMGQSQGPAAMAIGFLALLPLMGMMASGIFLLVQPWIARRRGPAATS